MSDQYSMFDLMNCPVSPNAISSPASADGASLSDLPDGQTTGQCGPVALPVSHSAWPAKVAAETTLDTSPPIFSIWSGPAAPECCLASKSQARQSSEKLQSALEETLQKRLTGLGSTMYRIAWKQHVTPLGRSISRQRASAHRTSDSAPTLRDLLMSGWPTTQASDGSGGGQMKRALNPERSNDLNDFALLAGWGTPMAHEARLGYQNRRNGKKGSQKSLTTECVDFLDPVRGDPALAGWPTTSANEFGHADREKLEARRKACKASAKNGNGFGLTLAQAMTLHEPGPHRFTASGLMLTGSDAEMQSGGQLNPEHSRWLMGFPAEWGSCGATAMQSTRNKRRSSSKA